MGNILISHNQKINNAKMEGLFCFVLFLSDKIRNGRLFLKSQAPFSFKYCQVDEDRGN